MEIQCQFITAMGQQIAKVLVREIEDGWYYGTLTDENFPPDLKEALAWYDEVVSDQLLSFADEAIAAVDKFQLQVCLDGEAGEQIYSLHVSNNRDVEFRVTPVPSPPESAELNVDST